MLVRGGRGIGLSGVPGAATAGVAAGRRLAEDFCFVAGLARFCSGAVTCTVGSGTAPGPVCDAAGQAPASTSTDPAVNVARCTRAPSRGQTERHIGITAPRFRRPPEAAGRRVTE